MKKLILTTAAIITTAVAFAQSFVNPIGYIDSETNRQQVVAYIHRNVTETYAKIGMNDRSRLRMIEDENLEAFKKLIQVKDTELLGQVIRDYSKTGRCDYSTFWMVYQEKEKGFRKTARR